MEIPFLAYVLSLPLVGFIHALLDPVADALFEASTNDSAVMTLLHASWNYVLILYAIVGAMVLFLYASKRGGGLG